MFKKVKDEIAERERYDILFVLMFGDTVYRKGFVDMLLERGNIDLREVV